VKSVSTLLPFTKQQKKETNHLRNHQGEVCGKFRREVSRKIGLYYTHLELSGDKSLYYMIQSCRKKMK
ncbi:hypothetical protein ACQP3F_30840, partial [Escherichia coli]